MSELLQILALSALLLFILILGVWGWKKLWFDQFGGNQIIFYFIQLNFRSIVTCFIKM